ncbi:MAG TPA: hypothetical protein VEC12_15810 [Bacteroidia bacterium]|nr:hypothetical protein [Bacteroidia bacterium]
MSGKEVASIIDNKTYSSGNYKTHIILDNIESGVYICTIIIGESVFNEKVVVIK